MDLFSSTPHSLSTRFILALHPLRISIITAYAVIMEMMPKGFSRSENLTKDTLLALAAIGVLFVAPMAAPLLQGICRKHFGDKNKATALARAKKLRELERRELISFTELNNGTVRIELTYRGKNVVRMYNLDTMRLTKPTRWDGKWRVIMYDIPLAKKKASDAFRFKIKQFGLFPLQKSVWISPYDCLSEIEFLTTVFEIELDKHIFYFTSKEVPREQEIKEFFELDQNT